MPKRFSATHPKINVTDERISKLTQAWSEYIEARVLYADTLMNYNWTHRGGKQDENPHRRTLKMSNIYDDYFEKMDTFKRAHAEYKNSVRELLRGKVL